MIHVGGLNPERRGDKNGDVAWDGKWLGARTEKGRTWAQILGCGFSDTEMYGACREDKVSR